VAIRCDACNRLLPAWGPGNRNVRTTRDFAITLSDGRRVVGHDHDGEWSISVYASDQEARLIGYGSARTRPHALEQAGLSSEDAGEVLGRAGI
jgi:hypothetical protein